MAVKSKWNFKTIKLKALKYNFRKDFNDKDKGAYIAAIRMGILNDVCIHMPVRKAVMLKWTIELLSQEAKKYNTRGEFQNGSPSAYTTARKRGLLNEICGHMIDFAFSIPQLICQQILDNVLQSKCLYNTRQIIRPYELDLYYPEFKLAIEYNGKVWHQNNTNDNIKVKMCQNIGIKLITIIENSRKYEEDVKNQIINNLTEINNITGKNISPCEIKNAVVNLNLCLNKTCLYERIKNAVAKYDDLKYFSKKEKSLYDLAVKLKIDKEIFANIKNSKRKQWNGNSIKEEISKYKYLCDFINNSRGAYLHCKKNNSHKEELNKLIRKH